MNIKLPWQKGWQLSSLSEPSVVARTWPNTRRDAVLEAIRGKFEQFQTGVVDLKTQGSAPSFGSVYQPVDVSQQLRNAVVLG
jgi:hypothetical protein